MLHSDECKSPHPQRRIEDLHFGGRFYLASQDAPWCHCQVCTINAKDPTASNSTSDSKCQRLCLIEVTSTTVEFRDVVRVQLDVDTCISDPQYVEKVRCALMADSMTKSFALTLKRYIYKGAV